MRRAVVPAILLMLMASLWPLAVTSAQSAPTDAVYINEILVSPNNENFGGTDWNGDGSIGIYSDQYLELHNPASEAIDIGGWWLDDIADGGSPACSIGWDTVLEPGAYVVFYRSWTGIEFDYWDGDTIRLLDGSGTEVDSVSYEGEDSDWDIPYGYDSTGNWVKLSDGSPTPGGANDQEWGGTNHLQGNCYAPRDHIHSGQYVLKGEIVTMASENAVIPNGNVLVIDGIIEAVWSDADPEPQAAEGVMTIDTSGTIYPGLIDAHNHAHYNYIPLWDHGTNGWQNRYQWQAEEAYKDAVSRVKSHVTSGGSAGCDLNPEGMKFAELRSLAGGTTAIQGSSTSDTDTFDSILARNVELYNFGRDYVWTKVSQITSDYEGNHIKEGNSSGSLDGWFLHLAEGVDEASRAEFDVLVGNDLLVGELIVIHGTALTSAEFEQMAAVGASLVWSPTSNLLLYGDTADIAAAAAAGVNIALAPDWAPSGMKNPLGELKVADWWDSNVLGDIFTDYEMVQMVTTNSARATNWEDETGIIAAGMAADLLVLDRFHDDPYRNLINAIDPDVRLVTVGGLPVFGDVDIMQALDDEIEVIHGDGFQKATDVTYDGVEMASKSYAQIVTDLAACMAEKTTNPMEELFTYGDDRFFDVLNRSATFQDGRTIDLWGDYYDIELDDSGHRLDGTVGGSGPIQTNNSSNGGNGETVPEPELPVLWPTYGPRGGTIPHLTTIEEGIHLEECESTEATLSGANVPTTPASKVLLCGAILIVMQPTADCIEAGGSFCDLEVADAVAVPAHLCSDSGTYPDEVTCRYGYAFMDAEEEPEPEPEPEPEEETWMDGALYWVAIFVALAVIAGSIGIINSNLRERAK